MDYAHEETDKVLLALERKIRKIYKTASAGVQEKMDEYIKEMNAEEWELVKKVDKGEMTQNELIAWRQEKLIEVKRWEELKDNLADDFVNANQIARSTVFGTMPDVYALNHNFATWEIENKSLMDTSYTLYDRATVERLIQKNPTLLPPPGKKVAEKIRLKKDKLWNRAKINSVMTQSILQGDSIPKIAKRLSSEMAYHNEVGAIRLARTMTTSAENQGRLDSYQRADDMGIKLKKVWIATLDNRTRHEHRELDGQAVPINEPFEVDGEELDCPADPTAPFRLIMNCRCTMGTQIAGFEIDTSDTSIRRSDKLGTMSYEEWRKAHG